MNLKRKKANHVEDLRTYHMQATTKRRQSELRLINPRQDLIKFFGAGIDPQKGGKSKHG